MISKQNILELEARRKIYNFILKNPGLHEREISRRLKIPKTTLKHHLRYLEKQTLVTIDYKEGYNRHYISNKIGKRDKEIIKLLRQKIPRSILLYVVVEIVSSQKELSRELEKNPATIAFHLQKLQKMDLIEIAPVGDGIVYRLSPSSVLERKIDKNEKIFRLKNPDKIYNLLITYNKSLSKEISFFLSIVKFSEYVWEDEPPKKLRASDKIIDTIVDAFFEVFPPPFCA